MTTTILQPTASLFQSLTLVAESLGDQTAIVDEGVVLSFQDLLARSELLSRSLEEAALLPGDRVGALLSNGLPFAISAFAAWKCGLVLVPLHVRLTERELLKQASDCGIRAVFTSKRLMPAVEIIQAQVPRVQHAWFWKSSDEQPESQHGTTSTIQQARQEGYAVDWGNDQPAATFFSTGSTGISKRISRSHRQVNGEVDSVCQVMKLGPGDRILGVSPFFHSYGIITGFLCPILSGAQTYTINDFFPKDVAALIKRERITGFPGVPFMYQQLADLSKDADLSSLRYAISAGAPLPPETAATFRSRFGLPIRQHYGTTETGSVSVEPDDPSEQQEMSVGLPFPGVRIQIVDESSHPIEPGEIGNVAISSAFAASEYESPSAPGDSAFRDNLFLPGDLGRINLLGRLVLCGRRRGFINVAGNKVDPAEVEAVLKQIPAVTEAVVLGLPDGAAGEKIKAALVTAEPCSRNEVYAHCSAVLADFKRPRIIEFRKELPRSPLGKILRKYLLDEQADEPRYVFDPRTGFRQATIALSEDPVSSSLATLSPVLRSLLVTDGTITKILEAFFWEPIDIDILKHTEDAAEIDDVEFGIRAGDSILRRRVILRGRFTASSYVFAETVIASEAFSPDFRQLLLEGRKGIGELLREQQLETYRELVGVERAEAGLWAGYLGIESTAPVAVRQYSIRHNGRSAAKILEVFPEHRFIDFR